MYESVFGKQNMVDIYQVYMYIRIYVYINIPGTYTKQRKSTTKLAYEIIYKCYDIIQEMRYSCDKKKKEMN